MSFESDAIVDRRRLRRKLTFWRVLAALVAIVALITVGVMSTPSARRAVTGAGTIARISINGLIRSDRQRVAALERLGKSSCISIRPAAPPPAPRSSTTR